MGISLNPFLKATANTRLRAVLAACLTSAVVVAHGLSKSGAVQLGRDLASVVKQTGVSPMQIKVIHRSPVLMQELEWRSDGMGSPAAKASSKAIVLRWPAVSNQGEVETEGLAADDMVEAISRTMGGNTHDGEREDLFGTAMDKEQEQVLAQSHDAKYHLDLIRSSYGGRYSPAGVLKSLEAPAATALAEAARLDNKKLRREIDRIAAQADS